MAAWQQDLTYNLRRLSRAPVLVITVILSIGIGIAANATIFSMVNRFVLRPAPVGDPSTLFVVTEIPEGEGCCNERDCHPVASRYTPEGPEGAWVLEIMIRNRWVKVPKDRILPQSSPDGGVHACYSDPAPYMTEMTPGLVIRCVIVGGST